jgi:uncharacterized membrane protein
VTTLQTGRLEAFSDGVFAIAITLLLLEISVPEGASRDLLGAFSKQWPSYLAYLVSFATIGAAWLAHSTITHYLHGVDALFLRVNLLLLLLISFLPFPTGLVADHVRDVNAERVATSILGIKLLMIALVVSARWRYAVRRELVRPDAGDEEVRMLTQRLTPGLAGNVGLIILGLVLPRVAVLGYLTIALLLIIPIGLRRAGSSG